MQVTKPTRRELIYTVTLPANISPLYQTTLYAKVSGYLKWIGPDKGDAVKKNQVVAIIDAPEVEEQYQQALSDYKIKKLTFERLAKVWKESPDVIAKQDVDVAEAAYQGAKTSDGAAGRACATTPKSARPMTASSRPVLPIPARLIQIATLLGRQRDSALHDHGPRYGAHLYQRAAGRFSPGSCRERPRRP